MLLGLGTGLGYWVYYYYYYYFYCYYSFFQIQYPQLSMLSLREDIKRELDAMESKEINMKLKGSMGEQPGIQQETQWSTENTP